MKTTEQNSSNTDKIDCPKKPDLDIMKMLVRANQFIKHAELHAKSGEEFDNMIAIHSMDNGIEYILRILIKHFDMENIECRTINTSELMSIYKDLNKFFNAHQIPSLHYQQQIETLRSQRNLVQHGITCPTNQVETDLTMVNRFFDKVLDDYFGMKRDEISYSTLINDNHVKENLKEAENNIEANKYLEGIIKSRDAFDYSWLHHKYAHRNNVWNERGMLDVKNISPDAYRWLYSLNEDINLSDSGIDMPKYYKYKEYMEYVPKEFWRDHSHGGHYGHQWSKNDALFVYNFVCNTILTWQGNQISDIDISIDKESNIRIEESFDGIHPLKELCKLECHYTFNDFYANLFYLNGIDTHTILHNCNDKYLWYETKRFVNGCLNGHSNSIIYVKEISKRLVLNDPEIWEIYIEYKEVPFTNQMLKIDIDKNEEFKETLKKHNINVTLPVRSYNDAQKLFDECIDSRIDTSNYFSSELIRSLSLNKDR